MNQARIFGPLFAMALLTLVVWAYMYSRRIPFILKSGVTPEELRIPGELARRAPPAVSTPSDNFKNLFELPVIFYVLLFYLYATGQVDELYLSVAWAFVGLRALHSLVHCTFNVVLLRFWLYFGASVALWFMVIRAALGFLGGAGA